MGDGESICFWSDIWIDDGTLRVRFPLIFTIVRDKDSSVKEVFNEGEGRRE